MDDVVMADGQKKRGGLGRRVYPATPKVLREPEGGGGGLPDGVRDTP